MVNKDDYIGATDSHWTLSHIGYSSAAWTLTAT